MLHLLGLLLLSGANTGVVGPSRVEFAKALAEFTRNPVNASDVRRLSCRGFGEEPTEAACRWEQRNGGDWKRFSTYVAAEGQGWVLIDSPSPIRSSKH
jgi:hypothetical protein